LLEKCGNLAVRCAHQRHNRLGKIIDLSGNKLSGKIPEEIITLVGLLYLNLSRNNLTGPIPLPPKIGQFIFV